MKKLFLILSLIIGINGLAQQEYSGGIETATGFKISDPQPIDDRLVVADSLSLLSLPNVYEGLTSYSISDKSLFVYDGAEWSKVGSGEVAGDFIPLSGTEENKPLTGNIVVDTSDGEVGLYSNDLGMERSISITDNGFISVQANSDDSFSYIDQTPQSNFIYSFDNNNFSDIGTTPNYARSYSIQQDSNNSGELKIENYTLTFDSKTDGGNDFNGQLYYNAEEGINIFDKNSDNYYSSFYNGISGKNNNGWSISKNSTDATNSNLLFPDSGITLRRIPVSVNGVYANQQGEITLPTAQFVQITENSKTGYGLKYRLDNSDNYGDIGNYAIDLSRSTSTSTTRGATGDYSTISGGQDNTVSGNFSTISGGQYHEITGNLNTISGGGMNIISGISSRSSTISGGESNTISSNGATISGGLYNNATGSYSSVSGGRGNTAHSLGEWVGGVYGTEYTPGSTSAWIGTDRIFNIGNGQTDITRSDAFTILKNGLATLPSVTNTLIDADPTGKAVITKEYFVANSGSSTPTLSEVLAEGNNAGEEVIKFEWEVDGRPPYNITYEIGKTPMNNSFSIRDLNSGKYIDFWGQFDPNGIELYRTRDSTIWSWEIGNNSEDEIRGIRGTEYYGANYDDNTYVQKKYVDDAIDAIPTPNLTLEQARQNGNVLEGDVEFLIGKGISSIEDGKGDTTKLSTDMEGFLVNHSRFPSTLKIAYNSLRFTNDTQSISLRHNTSSTNNHINIDVVGEESKGLVGSDEFDKQDDRKAFAQIADIEDAIDDLVIPEQVNLTAGTNVTITGTYPNLTINSTASGGGGDTNIIESISRNGVSITPDGSKNVDIPVFSTSGAGLVPARVGSVATKYLREDGTWVTPTNTTYPAMTLSNLNTGTATTANTISAQVLTNWLNGKISTVGFSGSYNDLTDKPTIPTTPNITQVLTEGNLIDDYFGTVMEFENPYGPNHSIFNEDGNLIFGNDNGELAFSDDGSIWLHSTANLKLNSQTFPSTAGTNGQVLTTDGTNMSWTTPSSGTTYSPGIGINITPQLPNDVISLKSATSSEIGGVKVWTGTQSAYDSLGTYDPNTLYYIEQTYTAGSRKVFEFTSDQTWTGAQSKLITLDQPLTNSDWSRKIKATISWTDPTTGYNEFAWYIGKSIISAVNEFNRSGTQLLLSLNVSSTFTIPAGAYLILEY